jgi:hypothetical protein
MIVGEILEKELIMEETSTDQHEKHMETADNATLLITEVFAAVERGTKHYHPLTNELLATPKAILQCLVDHGAVDFEPVSPAEG